MRTSGGGFRKLLLKRMKSYFYDFLVLLFIMIIYFDVQERFFM